MPTDFLVYTFIMSLLLELSLNLLLLIFHSCIVFQSNMLAIATAIATENPQSSLQFITKGGPNEGDPELTT